LTGKIATFGGSSQNVPQKNATIFADTIGIILRYQSNTSYAVSQLDFFQKAAVCHVLAAKSLSLRQKSGQGTAFLMKILWTGFRLKNLKTSTHAFNQANRTTGRGVKLSIISMIFDNFVQLVSSW